jgi:hypothetical protein
MKEICHLAGFASKVAWMNAIKDELFVAKVEALGVSIRKPHLASHLEVEPATHIEEELAKDVWDIRRFKSEYPKHRAPAQYVIDFSWISHLALREQVKCYFRQRITRWRAATFQRNLAHVKTVLVLLPLDVHIGTLQRSHIETVLPTLSQLSPNQACRGLREARIMFEYMAASPAWTGPRPPRFLIWKEDIPPRPEGLPRPIPPDVLDQLDPMLQQAEKAMQQGQEPGSLPRCCGMCCSFCAIPGCVLRIWLISQHRMGKAERDASTRIQRDTGGFVLTTPTHKWRVSTVSQLGKRTE